MTEQEKYEILQYLAVQSLRVDNQLEMALQYALQTRTASAYQWLLTAQLYKDAWNKFMHDICAILNL